MRVERSDEFSSGEPRRPDWQVENIIPGILMRHRFIPSHGDLLEMLAVPGHLCLFHFPDSSQCLLTLIFISVFVALCPCM